MMPLPRFNRVSSFLFSIFSLIFSQSLCPDPSPSTVMEDTIGKVSFFSLQITLNPLQLFLFFLFEFMLFQTFFFHATVKFFFSFPMVFSSLFWIITFLFLSIPLINHHPTILILFSKMVPSFQRCSFLARFSDHTFLSHMEHVESHAKQINNNNNNNSNNNNKRKIKIQIKKTKGLE